MTAIATTLDSVLLKPITDNQRTRRYQDALDRQIDELRTRWDLDRGMVGTTGMVLPHESDRQYWLLPEDEQARVTPAEVLKAITANRGRYGTTHLCLAAFCWHSPLSRHHRDPRLLAFFTNGLKLHVDSIFDDGFMGTVGFNGEGWAHGWDVEGLIYGLAWCRDALDDELVARARDRFARSAARFAALPRQPASIGSYGNQRCVFALGLYLYSQFLGDPELRALSEHFWQDAMPSVLDVSGQVIEQQGPCMHYSYTAFIYAWLNLAVRGDRSEDVRVRRCLEWFSRKHTRSLYPLAGPSTRQYYERMPAMVADILPAAEQQAATAPELRDFADRAIHRTTQPQGPIPPLDVQTMAVRGTLHAANSLIWAMLMCEVDGPLQPRRVEGSTFVAGYEATHVLKRSPLRYMVVHQQYQTQFTHTDFLPFSGIQTWALDEEPPIIHPTPLAPSTTEGYRLDTARQGVSHNWGLYGAGALGIDGYKRQPQAADELWLVVARYDWLWRVVVFSPRSTVIVEFGDGGERTTRWTLNRLEPADPVIGPGVVRFGDRKACLHSTAPAPRLETLEDNDEWATGVRQLVYGCGTGPAVFALSDASFELEPGWSVADGLIRFADATGRYELCLEEKFHLKPNPGNFNVDVYQLAAGTVARRISR